MTFRHGGEPGIARRLWQAPHMINEADNLMIRNAEEVVDYHLRLIICDIIRFCGRDLGDDDRAVVREILDGFLSDNPFMNSTVLDALEGVGGLEHDFTVEAAVQEYEAMLDQPETQRAARGQ